MSNGVLMCYKGLTFGIEVCYNMGSIKVRLRPEGFGETKREDKMKKNTMKNGCSNLLHRTIGRKPVRPTLVENLGKYKFVLVLVISFVLGIASIFMFGK